MSERIVEPRGSAGRAMKAAAAILILVVLCGCVKADNAATHFDPIWADQWSPAVTDAYGSEKIESRR
jgi:hypothetical protein